MQRGRFSEELIVERASEQRGLPESIRCVGGRSIAASDRTAVKAIAPPTSSPKRSDPHLYVDEKNEVGHEKAR
jgi:hypothetical protein